MEFFRLEQAIAKLGNVTDPYRASGAQAGVFENILSDEDTTPNQKAEQLAEVIEELIAHN